MSVRINENFNSSTDYAERLKEEQRAREAEKSKETGGGAKALGNVSEQCDEYISSEKSKAKTVGLYRVEQDKSGGQKILFDSPDKEVKASGQKQPAVKGDNSEKSPEKCIADTDKVEREIRELKEKKQQLEQQIRQISDDESKTRELEKKLAEVENELNQKDNDAYRRQNAYVVRAD